MNIPKVQFKYSWIYDLQWQNIYEDKGNVEKFGPYPKSKDIEKYISTIEQLWKKQSEIILSSIVEISGLDWQEEFINCYVVGWVIPFSDPLTIPMYREKPDYFIDTLTHELIHQLFVQNEGKLGEYWKHINSKYTKEVSNTRYHIPLHAIHTKIYKTIIGEDRLERDKNALKHVDAYRNSWKMVEKDGYENIISEIKSFIGK